jgi:hypothetical protein
MACQAEAVMRRRSVWISAPVAAAAAWTDPNTNTALGVYKQAQKVGYTTNSGSIGADADGIIYDDGYDAELSAIPAWNSDDAFGGTGCYDFEDGAIGVLKSSTQLDFTNQTLSFWVKALPQAGGTDYNAPISIAHQATFEDATPELFVRMQYSVAQVRGFFQGTYSDIATLTTDVWFNVTFTFTNVANTVFWHEGAKITHINDATRQIEEWLYLGQGFPDGLFGRVDELRIDDRIWTDVEIGAYGSNGTSPETSSMLVQWSMDTDAPLYGADDSPSGSPGNGANEIDWNIGTANEPTWGTDNGTNHYDFDGSADYGKVTATMSTNYPFTIAAWVWPEVSTGERVVFGYYDESSATVRYCLEINSGAWRCLAGNGQTQGGSAVVLSNWHHVVGVFAQSNDVTMYLNGSLDGTNLTVATEWDTNVDAFSIGRHGDSTPTGYWQGKIAEMRTYQTNLTAGQISDLYSNTPE